MNRPLVVGILCMCLHFLTLGSQLLAEVPECGYQAQPGDTIARMVQTTRNLAVVLVDFADGRVPATGEPPTTLGELELVPNRNAVGSLGWGWDSSAWVPKIRKYSWDDYWDMLFSQGVWLGDRHPDAISHASYDDGSGELYRLTSYGSVREYWREVSSGNLDIVPAVTRTTGGDPKYRTGIVNRYAVDSVTGRVHVKWLQLPGPKSAYQGDAGTSHGSLVAAVLPLLQYRHALDSTHPDYIEFDIDEYLAEPGQRANLVEIIGAGSNIGGAALNPWCSAAEKWMDNSDVGSVFGPLLEHTHELGHLFGFGHVAGAAYEVMHWGSLRWTYKNCPPHINPWFKLKAGWIPADDVRFVTGPANAVTISPLTSAQPTVAIVTVHGAPGRNDDFRHSEYLIVEYRRREKFNRFAGGFSTPGFQGGALVWHYGRIDLFPEVYGVNNSDVALCLGLKVAGYPVGMRYHPGDTMHFYPTHGTDLDETSVPNSHSLGGTPTGLALRSFRFLNGGESLSFDVQYSRGAPPVYTDVVYYSGGANLWTGTVFYQGGFLPPHEFSGAILPGTQVVVARDAPEGRYHTLHPGSITFKGATAVGQVDSPIVFRGIESYGNIPKRWAGLVPTRVQQETPPSRFEHCVIRDADSGWVVNHGGVHYHPICTITRCSFSNCTFDLTLLGSHPLYPALNIAEYDSIGFRTMRMGRGGLKLQGSNLVLADSIQLLLLRDGNGFTGWETRLDLHSQLVEVRGLLAVEGIARIENPLGCLRLGAGARVELDWDGKLATTCRVEALGTSQSTVQFASMKGSPQYADYWQALDLKGGPNILRHCEIRHSQHGVYFNNTTSTLLLDSCTIRNGSGYAVQAFNTSMNPNSLLIRDCTIDSNMNGITVQNGRIDIVQTSAQPGIRYNGYGIVAWTGGKVYAQNARVTNNNDWGVYVNGSTAQVSFTPNGLAPGFNRLRDNADGQLWVQSGSAFLGSTNTICICDPIEPEEPTTPDRDEDAGAGGLGGSLEANCLPPCYVSPIVYGGFNHVSGDWSSYKYWIKTQSAGVAARKTYWGLPEICPPPPGAFYGTVDRTECLTGGGESLTFLPGSEKGEPQIESFIDSTSVIALLQVLKEDLLLGTANARRALHELASLCGRGGGFSRFLRMEWRQLLELGLTRNLPMEVKNILKAYRLQDMMDTRQYDEAIAYGNTLSGSPNDELWFHAQATLVHAFAASGRLAEASAQFNRMKARGADVNPQATDHLEYFLSLQSGGGTAERIPIGRSTVVADGETLPTRNALSHAYPNPFNPSTEIRFDLPEPSTVSLAVYDLLGRKVADLAAGDYEAGYHSASWNATGVASGVYLARFTATSATGNVAYTKTHKLLLMK